MAVKSLYTTDLIYRKLDKNDDYVLGMNKNHVSGLDAMTQVLKTRLRVVMGEWWQGDKTALPYMNGIIGKKERSFEEIDLLIISRIIDTIGVLGVSDVRSFFDGRNYSFSCKVQTVYGDTTAEVSA